MNTHYKILSGTHLWGSSNIHVNEMKWKQNTKRGRGNTSFLHFFGDTVILLLLIFDRLSSSSPYNCSFVSRTSSTGDIINICQSIKIHDPDSKSDSVHYHHTYLTAWYCSLFYNILHLTHLSLHWCINCYSSCLV